VEFDPHLGVQAESVDVGAQGTTRRGLARHRTLQGEHLLPGALAEGDAIGGSRRLKRAQRTCFVTRGVRVRAGPCLRSARRGAAALAARTRRLLLDEPFECVAPVLSRRLAEVIAALKRRAVAVLVAQSDLNRSRRFVDSELMIERAANATAKAA
jgi:hypothetical protein